MKIECPECKYGGEVDDIKIPDAGIWGTCKKCKTRFFVKKEVDLKQDAQDEFQILTTNPTVFCPKCGIEQPHSEKCSECGIDISEFISSRLKNISVNKNCSSLRPPSDKGLWWKRPRNGLFGLIAICVIVSGFVVKNKIDKSNRIAAIAAMAAEREKFEKEQELVRIPVNPTKGTDVMTTGVPL